jgi:hypothetical protein
VWPDDDEIGEQYEDSSGKERSGLGLGNLGDWPVTLCGDVWPLAANSDVFGELYGLQAAWSRRRTRIFDTGIWNLEA